MRGTRDGTVWVKVCERKVVRSDFIRPYCLPYRLPREKWKIKQITFP